MTDKTQPDNTELRTEIERILARCPCRQLSKECVEYHRASQDKSEALVALFSKTIATKTREAVDNLLDEMIAVQERHITEAVRVSGLEEAKDTLGWLRGWRKSPTGEK